MKAVLRSAFGATCWRSLASCCALAGLVLLAACSGRVELVAAVAEAEANEALAALLQAGVRAEKVPGKEGMVGISVAGGQVALAVDVLKARGLPRERYAGITPGYHMNKQHWNTVVTDGSVPARVLLELADHSYDLVRASLPKKQRDGLT